MTKVLEPSSELCIPFYNVIFRKCVIYFKLFFKKEPPGRRTVLILGTCSSSCRKKWESFSFKTMEPAFRLTLEMKNRRRPFHVCCAGGCWNTLGLWVVLRDFSWNLEMNKGKQRDLTPGMAITRNIVWVSFASRIKSKWREVHHHLRIGERDGSL